MTSRQLFFICLFAVFFSLEIRGAPANSVQSPDDSTEVLHNIIVELENVLFKLKDYARSVHTVKQVAQYKEQGVLDSIKSQNFDQHDSAGQRMRQPSRVQQGSNDVSLQEALEYLVDLAKQQKKVERRDHDIPFPLIGRGHPGEKRDSEE